MAEGAGLSRRGELNGKPAGTRFRVPPPARSGARPPPCPRPVAAGRAPTWLFSTSASPSARWFWSATSLQYCSGGGGGGGGERQGPKGRESLGEKGRSPPARGGDIQGAESAGDRRWACGPTGSGGRQGAGPRSARPPLTPGHSGRANRLLPERVAPGPPGQALTHVAHSAPRRRPSRNPHALEPAIHLLRGEAAVPWRPGAWPCVRCRPAWAGARIPALARSGCQHEAGWGANPPPYQTARDATCLRGAPPPSPGSPAGPSPPPPAGHGSGIKRRRGSARRPHRRCPPARREPAPLASPEPPPEARRRERGARRGGRPAPRASESGS